MSGELFELPESKSPRLRWIEKYGIKTFQTKHNVGDEGEFGEELWPWYAFDAASERCGGATEDGALTEWAKVNGKRMWNEEGL